MTSVRVTRMGWMALPLAIAAVILSGPLTGQEPAAPKPAAKAEKKATGRLPTYYAQVVTPEQRTKIYSLQAEFGAQIQKLRDELAATEMEQKAAIEAVLTPEQRQQVAKLAEDARARRSKRSEPAPAPAAAAVASESTESTE